MDAKATVMESSRRAVENREIPYSPPLFESRVEWRTCQHGAFAKLEFRGKCFASLPDACPRRGRCAARAAARRLADARSVLARSAANRQPARGRVQRR